MSKRAIIRTEGPRRKLLLWAALAGLVFGLIGFGDIAEGLLRTARDRTHWHKASGDIVLVKIDNQSLRDVGRWPWPRRYHGELVDRLSAAGAKRILFDINFFGATDEANDRALADALKRSHRTILATRTISGPLGWTEGGIPLPNLSYAAQGLGTISWRYNFRQTVTGIPYAGTINGKTVPSFSALLAGRQGAPAVFFQPDYSLDPKSIPTVSASAVLQGKFDPGLIRGKEIVIGTASEEIGDQFFVPGVGRLPGVYVHVIGAETLKGGAPVELGWFPLFLLALGIGATALSRREGRWQGLILAAGTVVLTFGPAVPEAYHIFLDVTPALFVIGIIAGVLSWRRYRARGLVNPISDLPNLNALARQHGRQETGADRRSRSQLRRDRRDLAAEQRAAAHRADRRRDFRSGRRTARFIRATAGSSPGSSNRARRSATISTRFTRCSATRHASPASRSILRSHSESRSAAAGRSPIAWRAPRRGRRGRSPGSQMEVPRPRNRCRMRRGGCRCSASSMKPSTAARCGSPTSPSSTSLRAVSSERRRSPAGPTPRKGPIAASEFVAAAEQHNRIGKLTDFVLEKAVAAAAQINKRGPAFHDCREPVSAAFHRQGVHAFGSRHSWRGTGFPPSRPILELTETAALADSGEALDMINRLRDLGVEIAIDDYGTGQSTLDYLKRIPASEIKIDQSFVKGIVDNRSDRLMVQSTIGLVHSLGRKVVAEGVENRDILDVLIELECDIAQGFAVGRPMSLETLTKRLSADRKRQVA